MDTYTRVLVLLLASTLTVFLIVMIFALIKVIRVLDSLKRMIDKAEAVADKVESIGEFFQKTTAASAAGKLLANITDIIRRKKHVRRKDHDA